MNAIPKLLNILNIEDNKGDQLLVSDYLEQEIPSALIKIAETFDRASKLLLDKTEDFNLILLDLTLPDKQGEDLLKEILQLCGGIPIIVLTGYIDIQFSVKSLVLGTSDYLLKDTLTAASLYKSIAYTFERRLIDKQLIASKKRYQDLFQLNPQPIFIISVKNLNIVDVNKAAEIKYDCSREEFLQLKMTNFQEDFNDELVQYFLTNKSFRFKEHFKHKCKNNEEALVVLNGNLIDFKGQKAILLLAIDITERFQYISKIEKQNQKLSDIAWQQSHMVRAPLTRLMGLINLFEMEQKIKSVEIPEELNFLLTNMLSSAHEIDKVIKEIVKNTYDDGEVEEEE
jgi:PAS domain S-box-containing protein